MARSTPSISGHPKIPGTEPCPFCLETRGLKEPPLFQNDSFFVLGMRNPDRQHAVMLIPIRHVSSPFDITGSEWADIAEAMAFAKDFLAPWRADGYSVGWNVGEAGGQHVGHAHMHVICRFENQTATGLGLNGLITRVNSVG